MDSAEGGVQVGRLRSAVIARSVSDEAIQAYFNKTGSLRYPLAMTGRRVPYRTTTSEPTATRL